MLQGNRLSRQPLEQILFKNCLEEEEWSLSQEECEGMDFVQGQKPGGRDNQQGSCVLAVLSPQSHLPLDTTFQILTVVLEL